MTVNRRITEVVNNTGSTALYFDQVLEAGEIWEIVDRKLQLWRDDITISGAISSGTLGVRDGEQEFTETQDALQYFYDNPRPLRPTTIQIHGQPSASALTTTSGVDALGGLTYTLSPKALVGDGGTTVVSGSHTVTISGAAGTNPPGQLEGQIVQIEFTSGSADEWMSISSEDHNSDQHPYVFPFPAVVVAIAYTNEKSDTQFEVEIHKSLAGAGAANSIVHTWTVGSGTPCRTAYNTLVFDSDVSFETGDKMAIFLAANGGTEPAQAVVPFYVQISADETKVIVTENFSGDFTT